MTAATLIEEPANSSAPKLLSTEEGTRQALPLGERLLHAGVVTSDELEAALREQNTKQLRPTPLSSCGARPMTLVGPWNQRVPSEARIRNRTSS